MGLTSSPDEGGEKTLDSHVIIKPELSNLPGGMGG